MSASLQERIKAELEERRERGLERTLAVRRESEGILDLSNNDYLRMSVHPRVKRAAVEALECFGASSSASPLVSGFTSAHFEFLEKVKAWHGFGHGMVWNSGYAANQAALSLLPRKGDLVLADRLIHHSMVAGLLRSGARLIRYPHCSEDSLEALLETHAKEGRQVFVVTESVFSMDGDSPDLARIAALKRRFPFFWIVDEAHAIGWYGSRGSGLVEACGCQGKVDMLVGTLGKGLGSAGAYTLFHESDLARYLVNFAGEFIYSTFLPPSAVAAAGAAIDEIETMGECRAELRQRSSAFRSRLQGLGFEVGQGDSPIVPVIIGDAAETLAIGEFLRERGVLVGTIRPPTVPKDESRLRISLNSGLGQASLDRVADLLAQGKEWACR